MKTDKYKLRSENDLDELIRSSYGLSDSQLEDDLYLAEHQIPDSQVPPLPHNGFQQIIEKKEKRNIKGYHETHPFPSASVVPKEESQKRSWIFSPTGRTILAVLIVITVLMCSGLTASGKRSFEYVVSERENVRDDIVLNNDENKRVVGSLEDAYEQIHDELGIEVLKLGYMPEKMIFNKLQIGKKHAVLTFDYKGNKIYLIENFKNLTSSSNIISGRDTVVTSFNDWLVMDLVIKSLKLEDGSVEYGTEIKINDAYYYITGIIELEEFKMIVENLNFL